MAAVQLMATRTRSPALAAFLAEATHKRFAWGQHDCMLFAADWVMALSGKDPAAPWRGSYDSEAGAQTIVDRAGGIGLLMRGVLVPLGWRPRLETRMGDVLILMAPTRAGRRFVAGICVGDNRHALVTARGLAIGPSPVMLAWRRGSENA